LEAKAASAAFCVSGIHRIAATLKTGQCVVAPGVAAALS
jgi:hypothetical protein